MTDFTPLDSVRRRRPLIHCVSNSVSLNDCANLVLAVGASPIMAHAPEEAADLTAASGATVLVAGSAVYRAEDIPARIRELRG